MLVQRVPVLYSLLTRPERETIGKKNLDSLIVPLNGLECILRILTTGAGAISEGHKLESYKGLSIFFLLSS